MPLEIQKPEAVIQPNAVYVPQIILNTAISEGKLVASVHICLMPANYTDGVWTESGGKVGYVNIGNVEKLDEDLAGLQEQANQLFGGFVQIIGQINAIRKLV